MSRSEGFPIADVDVGILDDPKVRALVRSTRDEALVARTMVAYMAVVTSSWGRGERVTLEDAVPLWITGIDDLSERLTAVGLLDAEARIPERSWTSWFQPAWDRREERRESGRKGGYAKHRNQSLAEPEQSQSEAKAELYPSVPSVPSIQGPSVPGTREPPSLNGTNGNERSTCPTCGDLLEERDANVVVIDRRGRLGHRDCPAVALEMAKLMEGSAECAICGESGIAKEMTAYMGEGRPQVGHVQCL